MYTKKVSIFIVTFILLSLLLPFNVLAQEPAQCETKYTVQAGDWLSKLAEKYLGNVLAFDQIVAATNGQIAAEFAAIENPDIIEAGWVLCIPAADAAPEAGSDTVQATIIELLDGTQCTFAGTGATLAFAGKRLNYTCGQQDEDEVGLLGDVLVQNGNLIAEKAVIGHNDSGFFVKETVDVSGPVAVVEMGDGNQCLNAGQGATLAFDGKRLNFDCGQQDGQQTGLLGDLQPNEALFMAEKALIGHNDSGFFVETSEVVPTALVSQQEPGSSGPELVGPVWYWVQTQMNNDDLLKPTGGTYTVQFLADGQVAIQADCNQVSGSYTLDGSSMNIQLGPSTLAFCPEGSLGDAFVANLGAAAGYFFQDEDLYIGLMFDSGTMKFSASADAAMADSSMAASTETTATEVIPFDPATITLNPDRAPLPGSCQPSTTIPGTYQCSTDAGSSLAPCFSLKANTLLCGPNPVFDSYQAEVTVSSNLAPAAPSQNTAFFLQLEGNNPPCSIRTQTDGFAVGGQPVTYNCEAPGAWIVEQPDQSQPAWLAQYVITNTSGDTVTSGPTATVVAKAWIP